MKRILAAAFLMMAVAAHAAVTVSWTPNYDGTLSSKYPSGDKPLPAAACPSGWTCVGVGGATGEVNAASASNFQYGSVVGLSTIQKSYRVYKDAGSGDVQIKARILNDYSGNLAAYTSIGIGLGEDPTSTTAYFFQCFAPYAGSAAVQSNYGTTAAAFTNANGAPGQSRPRYVGITYDVSEGDLRCHESSDGSTWVQVSQTTRTMSDVVAYVFAASGSSTESMSGSADNIALGSSITIYTPDGGGGGGGGNNAPVVDTAIANQTAAQGVAFSLTVSSNFSDPDDNSLSFSQSGLPASGGLSMSSAGVFSGTPNAADVSASPFNVTVTASDGSATVSDTFQMTVTAAAGGGDTFNIGTSTSSFNCQSQGVEGGDTIVLAAGTHVPLTISNCTGTASSRITIRNDTSGGGPAIFSSSSSAAKLTFDTFEYVTIDGTGKWSGAPSGSCGINSSTHAESETTCGIQATRTGSTHPTFYVGFKGKQKNVTMKGVEIDGVSRTGGGSGIGLNFNDHGYQASANPNTYREDVLITQNFIHDLGTSTSGECLYIGPNVSQGDVPLRRFTISWNLIRDCSRDGIQIKSLYEGPNYIIGNHIYRTGLAGAADESGQHFGISTYEGGDMTVERNYIEDAGESGIQFSTQALPSSYGPFYTIVRDNIVVRPGAIGPLVGHCITASRPSSSFALFSPNNWYNNTCIEPEGNGANFSGTTNGTNSAANNIFAGVGGSAVSGSSTNTNNLTGTVSSIGFVNSGADTFAGYHIGASSAAKDTATSGTTSSTDIDGDDRPNGSAKDRGADEYTP